MLKRIILRVLGVAATILLLANVHADDNFVITADQLSVAGVAPLQYEQWISRAKSMPPAELAAKNLARYITGTGEAIDPKARSRPPDSPPAVGQDDQVSANCLNLAG